MTGHAVVIAGGGPTGLMLAGELALAGTDVAIVERRTSQVLAGSRARGLYSRTIEVLDQRGIADRFLSEGQVHPVVAFVIRLNISDFPTRHPYTLALGQDQFERIMAGWVSELGGPVYRGLEVTGCTEDGTGVPVLHGPAADLEEILDAWLAKHAEGEGIACVIGDPTFLATSRVRSLTPELAKGLEFDLVVLVDPEAFGTGIEGAVDRYVAMTRATQRLVLLASSSESGSTRSTWPP